MYFIRKDGCFLMKRFISFLCALLFLLSVPTAFAAKATPTPPPVQITEEAPVEVPEQIQNVLDIAYREWEELNGQTLKRVNKYTEWRGKGVGFGWCGGYVTWCMMEAGVEMDELEAAKKAAKDSEDGIFMPVEGVHHIKEASVGKLLRGYQLMNRTSKVPQPGFLLVYGCSFNKTIHVALVYDVKSLGDGKYRITTLEGNMSNRVKMYIHDYDMNAEVNTNKKTSTNLFEVPEAERVLPESDALDYTVVMAKPSDSTSSKYAYYVNCFLMPYVPGEATPTTETPVE